MRTSESIDQLAPALIKAQAAISSVTKDKVGKVQSKSGASYEYRYSDLAAVIAEVTMSAGITSSEVTSLVGI